MCVREKEVGVYACGVALIRVHARIRNVVQKIRKWRTHAVGTAQCSKYNTVQSRGTYKLLQI